MMEPSEKQLKFQKLVDELMKSKPNQSKVRELTSKLGLPYKLDPIAQLDFVLKSAHGFFVECDLGSVAAPSKKSDLER